MLEKEFPIPLNDETTRMACITILLGGTIIRFAGWSTIGWVSTIGWLVVAYGALALWLAYLIAIAPISVEPTDTADPADW
jgi:hypothetical protein